jgi:hypothetical protein
MCLGNRRRRSLLPCRTHSGLCRLRRSNDGDALHRPHGTVARTGVDQACKQRSKEKQHFHVNYIGMTTDFV